MPTVATTRNYFSDVVQVKGADDLTYFTAIVNVKTTSGTKTVNPLGLALVWDNTISAFKEVVSGTTVPAQASSLPDAAPMALSVGDGTGAGQYLSDVTLSTTSTPLTVIFRGGDDLEAIFEGINFESTATTTEKTLFRTQLEKQGVKVINKTSTVAHTYV